MSFLYLFPSSSLEGSDRGVEAEEGTGREYFPPPSPPFIIHEVRNREWLLQAAFWTQSPSFLFLLPPSPGLSESFPAPPCSEKEDYWESDKKIRGPLFSFFLARGFLLWHGIP